MKERLYLFLGLFFATIPAFAVDPTGGAATAALISAGVSALSSIFGGVSAGRARRQAERRERAAAANRMALEANRVDPPDFGADFENPAANLQVATQANLMAAEQADISLASTLDTLRATGASAGGATALARAAAQSKRGVSAQIEKQEAANAQLRAQGELQAAKIRQNAQVRSYQATLARENQALNRAASLESSFSQQAAAYGAQSSRMIGQAVGAVGTFAAYGGFGAEGPFAKSQQPPRNFSESGALGSGIGVDFTTKSSDFNTDFNKQFNDQDLYGNFISNRAEEYINTAPNFGSLPPGQQNVIDMVGNIPTNPYAGMGITDEAYNSLAPILNTPIRIN